MRCVKCNNIDTKVIDSRITDEGRTVRRRRECEYCGTRFTTFEKAGITDLVVVKKDGTTQLYDRYKIRKSLVLSFSKRNTTIEQIEEIISNLEIKWIAWGKEIPSKQIGKDILEMLKEIDFIAYIRFCSVYEEFSSIEDFKNLIDQQN